MAVSRDCGDELALQGWQAFQRGGGDGSPASIETWAPITKILLSQATPTPSPTARTSAPEPVTRLAGQLQAWQSKSSATEAAYSMSLERGTLHIGKARSGSERAKQRTGKGKKLKRSRQRRSHWERRQLYGELWAASSGDGLGVEQGKASLGWWGHLFRF